jgi:hypothetical protein
VGLTKKKVRQNCDKEGVWVGWGGRGGQLNVSFVAIGKRVNVPQIALKIHENALKRDRSSNESSQSRVLNGTINGLNLFVIFEKN